MKILFCLVVAFALTYGCVRDGPKDDDNEDDHSGEKKEGDKKEVHRLLFALYAGSPGMSYLDDSTGRPDGMFKEIVERACEFCRPEGVACDTVWIGPYGDRCYDPVKFTGEGLMNHHYHACVGWVPTIDRMNIFNFSAPFMASPRGAIYAKPGTGDFSDPNVWPTIQLGIRQYWFLDQRCVNRHLSKSNGMTFPDDHVKVVLAYTWQEMRDHLDNGEFNLVMLPYGDPVSEGLEMIGDPIECGEGGFSFMHRKDMDMAWFSDCMRGAFGWMDGYNEYWNMCQRWGVSSMCFSKEEYKMAIEMDKN